MDPDEVEETLDDGVLIARELASEGRIARRAAVARKNSCCFKWLLNQRTAAGDAELSNVTPWHPTA